MSGVIAGRIRGEDRRCIPAAHRWWCTVPDLLNVPRRRRICRWRCTGPGMFGIRSCGRVRRWGCVGPLFAPRYRHLCSDGPGVRRRPEVLGFLGDCGLAILDSPHTTIHMAIRRSGLAPDRPVTRHLLRVTAAPVDSNPVSNVNRTVWGSRTGTNRIRRPCFLDLPGRRTTIR